MPAEATQTKARNKKHRGTIVPHLCGGVVIAELDNGGDLVKEYVRGLGLGGGIGGILYCKEGSDFHYYHYDGSGNVTSVTDDEGDEVAIYEYDAFGNVITEAGSLSNEFKFSTKQADKRGELIDFGFRWYDPEVGRWTQRDPTRVPTKTLHS
jgi:RHS repeat-associated protein